MLKIKDHRSEREVYRAYDRCIGNVPTGIVYIRFSSEKRQCGYSDRKYCGKQYLQHPFCGRDICFDYTGSFREQIYSGFHCGCGSGCFVVDFLFQRKEPEPCGGRPVAAWIFGIFYLLTVNLNLWGSDVKWTE